MVRTVLPDAVGIRREIHRADAPRGRRNREGQQQRAARIGPRRRTGFETRAGGVARKQCRYRSIAELQCGQVDIRRCGQYLAEPRIIIGAQDVLVAEENVEDHRAGLLCEQRLEQHAVHRAWPRPFTDIRRHGLHAPLIDVYQDDRRVTRAGLCAPAHQLVAPGVVETLRGRQQEQ